MLINVSGYRCDALAARTCFCSSQAGFRHTVCTLWDVSDRAYADIAQGFYRQITIAGLNGDVSAAALHAVVTRFCRA